MSGGYDHGGSDRSRFFIADAEDPNGMREASAAEARDLRDAARQAHWEPAATFTAPSVREDLPLGRLSDDDLEQTAAMARKERDFDGDDPEGAATIARAVEAEMARRTAEREHTTSALDALLDRAQELQATAHAGDGAEASEARRQLRELDDVVSQETRYAPPNGVSGQVAEYVALMNEDYTPAVEREGRARREHIRAALAPEQALYETSEHHQPAAEYDLEDRNRSADDDVEQRAAPPSGRIREALEPEAQRPEKSDEEMER